MGSGVRSWVGSMIAGACSLLVVACASEETPKVLQKDFGRPLPEGAPALELVTDPAQYPDFRLGFGDQEATLRAIEASLKYFSKPSSRRHPVIQGFTHERIIATLEAMKVVFKRSNSPEELSGFMHLYFEVYRSVGWDGSGEVLYTAYCQPVFPGSRERTARFQYPLYGLPPDLVKTEDGTPLGRQAGETVVAYYTRKDIETKRIFDGQGLEVAWLESPLDAFVVHVQGSTKIIEPDGKELFLGYAGKTDRPYTSIGQKLVADGRFPAAELSLTRIRRYFAEHPEDLESYLHTNESFVFFTETGPGGPYGSLGAPVTSYRTIATDKSIFPRGSLCVVQTKVPRRGAAASLEPLPYTSFALDQDTGGAIRSAGRCDLFLGTGDEAERVAGYTQAVGRLFYLLVKPSAPLGEAPRSGS